MKRIILILLIILLTGCVKYKMELYVYDNDAKIVYSIMINKKQFPKDSLGNFENQLNDKSIKVEANEDFVILSKEFSIPRDSFEYYGIKLINNFNGYELQFTPYTAMKINKEFTPQINATIPIDIIISINKGKIVEHNTGIVKDNMIIITTNMESIDKDFIINTRINTFNSMIYYIVFLLFIILFVVIIIIIKIKEKNSAS